MSFDWQTFLEQRGIDFADRGPSTSRGNVYIHCPFCGNADQGRHMGISTEDKGWGCWRNQAHRGKNPQRLVQAILGCSWAEAAKIVGRRLGGGLWGAEDAIGTMLAGFESTPESIVTPLDLPDSFEQWTPKTPAVFVRYLMDRGYSKRDIAELVPHYHLYWALTGPQSYRIIFPIYDENNALVTWTGRAIGDASIRYNTLSVRQPGRPPNYGPEAHGPITDYLLDMRTVAQGGHILVITEGPFDAANLFLGRTHDDIVTTCLFGKAVSDRQLDILSMVRDKYDAMFLLLDPEASIDALDLSGRMSTVGVTPFQLEGNKDPGELNSEEMSGLFAALLSRASSFANSGERP